MNRFKSLYYSAGPAGSLLTILEHLTLPNPYKRIADNLGGMRALEIGGPSSKFAPIYAKVKTCDNVTFARETIWEGKIGEEYRPAPNIKGKQFFRDVGLDLGTYDVVLSCHVIEHIANPIKALKEWRKTADKIVLVAPYGKRAFDHKRDVTTLEHLIDDYEKGEPEDSMRHAYEVLRKHDIRRDPALSGCEELELRIARNADLRTMHHHVFSPELVKEMLGYVGYSVEVETRRPYDIIAVSR